MTTFLPGEAAPLTGMLGTLRITIDKFYRLYGQTTML